MGVLDQFRLDGRVAVVTGAGKGIGRGIALALAEAGAHVAVAARSESDLASVAEEIRGLDRRAAAIPTDVTQAAAQHRLATQASDALGPIDIWVNNAGGLPDGTPRWLTRTSEEEWDAQLDLNLKAVWAGCVEAAAAMKGRGGAIVNISSNAGREGASNMKNGPYGASKAATNSLTRSFALELAPEIRVNAVAPGPIPTENFVESMKMDSPEREKELKKMIALPLRRWGTPEDIGAAVVYLSSPASSWITGQVLYVTGGS